MINLILYITYYISSDHRGRVTHVKSMFVDLNYQLCQDKYAGLQCLRKDYLNTIKEI